jgi:acetyl-CoA acetyltransferase
VQLEERFTTAPGEAVQLAAEAVAAGAAAVLAVGGDGTIHEVGRSSSSSSSSGKHRFLPTNSLTCHAYW